jgi:hypothetical protein
MSARLQRPGRSLPFSDEGEVIGETYPSTSSTTNKAPPVDAELLEHLRDLFIVRVNQDYVLRTYDRMVGNQEVINYLQALHDQQNKK